MIVLALACLFAPVYYTKEAVAVVVMACFETVAVDLGVDIPTFLDFGMAY
jgi:hypothetical protein